MPVLVLSTIPSASTRLIVASLYTLPLTVLKSSDRAIDADRSGKTAIVVAQCFTRRILPPLLSTRQCQNDMRRSAMTRGTFTIAVTFLCGAAAAEQPAVTVVSSCECQDAHGIARWALKTIKRQYAR